MAHTSKAALKAQEIHKASPVAAAAVGRLITSAALLAADFKESWRIRIDMDGNGPIGPIVAEARSNGKLRATLRTPQVSLPLRSDGKLAVGRAVGRDGLFKVTREEYDGVIYQGQVELVSGEVGQDLAQYYTLSEQIPSAVALGVLVGRDSMVQAAGGLVVQRLPGGSQYIGGITERFSQLDHISHRLVNGDTVEQLAEEVLSMGSLHWFEREPLFYQCECSRTRSMEILSSLPREEIQELIKDQGAEIVCHYCRSAYRFSVTDMEKLLDHV
ncbi:MAG: Hsp33 family molecular chaperone HslO [Firmicutes bacterium]|nr:Hsp33 family molecular chaperone HslO [Bacillota bacterium]